MAADRSQSIHGPGNQVWGVSSRKVIFHVWKGHAGEGRCRRRIRGRNFGPPLPGIGAFINV